ncbi:MAG: AMP-binding protein [Candidatus Thermoplasmatota archaeon]|nr:AMP-binding protein [Candidatus Thermoplasmatota archaeon]
MSQEHNVKDYDKEYAEFKWNIPENFNFAWDVVDKWAEDRTKLAMISVDNDGKSPQYHSFWDLKVESNRFANMLRDMGLKKGDKLFIMLPRIPEWYVAILGAMKIGVVFMPTPTLSTTKDINFRINQAEAVGALTSTEYADRVDEAAPECPTLKHKIILGGEKKGWHSYEHGMKKASRTLARKDVGDTHVSDHLLIYFTSGTESYPKMVLHTHRYPHGHRVTGYMIQDLKTNDLQWTIADTGWAKTAWGKLFPQWLHGSAFLQWNMTGRFNPKTVLEIIQNYGVTVFCAPPTAYRLMILEKDLKDYDFAYLRHSLSAGEPLNPEVIKVWKQVTGLDIYDYFGQTESVALLGNCPAFPIRAGSMGKPTLGHKIALVDEEGNPVPVGEEGQIVVSISPEKPPGIMEEYWKNPEGNAKAFKDGWYYTGDKAFIDKDGYYWFVGRADDVIKSSGYRIGPFEVESALQEHDAVMESAVIGVPDEARGAIVKAYVILAPGFQGSDELVKELQNYVKTTTAPYKYPREIEFVTELPKTISGKIRRTELRKMAIAQKQGQA